MALVTCPTCGSLTIGEHQTCLRCRASATDLFRQSVVNGRNGHTDTSASPVASASAAAGTPSARESRADRLPVPGQADADALPAHANGALPARESETAASMEPPRPTHHPSSPGSNRGWPPRILLGVGVLMVLLIAVALVTGPASPTTTAVPPPHAVATHTPAPTATATGTPLPTAQPGYAVYADVTNGFLIQYPAAWQATHNDAGVAISDNSPDEGYVLQVYREDPATCPAADPKTAAACWVDFFLSHFPSLEAVQNVQRLTGPSPAVTFGGETWQTGVATFVLADSPNRIQVFATVHDQHPYLIAILAPDSLFATGSDAYFKPMMATFQFRSSTAP